MKEQTVFFDVYNKILLTEIKRCYILLLIGFIAYADSHMEHHSYSIYDLTCYINYGTQTRHAAVNSKGEYLDGYANILRLYRGR